MKPKYTIAYICDRKQCANCSYPECRHTTNIEHSVNYKEEPNIGELLANFKSFTNDFIVTDEIRFLEKEEESKDEQ